MAVWLCVCVGGYMGVLEGVERAWALGYCVHLCVCVVGGGGMHGGTYRAPGLSREVGNLACRCGCGVCVGEARGKAWGMVCTCVHGGGPGGRCAPVCMGEGLGDGVHLYAACCKG